MTSDAQSADKALLNEKTESVTHDSSDTPNNVVGSKIAKLLSIHNLYLRLFLAEFIGTFTLVILGDGVVAQTVLSQREPIPRGNIGTIHWGWGLAVTMGILVSGGVSGGHINPAFSFVCALLGKLTWKKLPIYWLGQYCGAFVGSACVFLVYFEKLKAHDLHFNVTRATSGAAGTAGIFSTYPSPDVSSGQAFFDQIVGTALLVMLALAAIDECNFNIPHWFLPFQVGLIVSAIVAAYEFNCGAALNPARDFSPRLFTAMAGWGTNPFSHRDHTWFLVPIFGPHLGALVGAGIYMIFIGIHWPSKQLEHKKRNAYQMKQMSKPA